MKREPDPRRRETAAPALDDPTALTATWVRLGLMGDRDIGSARAVPRALPLLGIDHTDAFDDLDDRRPLLLLPVRLETTFDGDLLRVRVYPDQIHIDGHTPHPTRAEVALGRKFWRAYRGATTDDERHAAIDWLTARIPVRRAAWVATATRPRVRDDGTLAFRRVQTSEEPVRPVARCLPRRWAVAGFLGAEERFVEFGAPIPDELVTSPVLEEAVAWSEEAGALPVDEAVAWMVDYTAAEDVGMGITVDLGAVGLSKADHDQVDEEGWTIVVVGVGDGTPKEQRDDLVGLLRAHLYTDGLEFAPQGTPTNNTDAAIAGWTREIDDVYGFFARELEGEGVVDPNDDHAADTDAVRLSTALGLRGSLLLGRVRHGGAVEELSARDMNRVLWPATLGSYFDDMLAPEGEASVVPEAAVVAVWDWFVANVRGGAPLPVIAAGAQPYGILPVRRTVPTPLQWTDAWPWLESILFTLRDDWRASLAATDEDGSPRVPRLDPVLGATVGEASNRETDIATILSMLPHPGKFLLRRLYDQRELRLDVWDWFWQVMYDNDPPFYGLGQWLVTLEGRTYSAAAQAAQLRRFKGAAADYNPAVSPRWVQGATHPSEPAGPWIDAMIAQVEMHGQRQEPVNLLAPTLVDGMLGRGIDDPKIFYAGYGSGVDQWQEWHRALVEEPGAGGADRPAEYLHHLRDRVSAADPRARFDLGQLTAVAQRDLEVGTAATAHERFGHSSASLLQRSSVTRTLQAATRPAAGEVRTVGRGPGTPAAEPGQQAPADLPLLYQLVDAVVDELPEYQRRAYPNALSRLADAPPAELELRLRETMGLASHRLDAWFTGLARQRLDELRSAAPQGIQLGGFGWVEHLRPDPAAARPSQGFIHTPSLAHATTAAILRAGWSAHGTGASDSTMAVDLRSDRVRLAAWLLDGIAQGQALGDLLGYRFERALHESQADQFIDDCRRAVLLAHGDTGEPRGPVDGLELAELYLAGDLTVTVDDEAVAVRPGDEAAAPLDRLQRALDGMLAAMDAVADAGLADSVHAIAQGNVDRASATLDALSTGAVPPPELLSMRTPRLGPGVAHAVVALLGRPAGTPKWAPSPRAQVDPELEAAAAQLLGDPARVACTVHGEADGLPRLGPITVTMADLRIGALDAVYEAPAADEPSDPMWGRRAKAFVAARHHRYAGGLRVSFGPAGDATTSFQEFALLAGTVRTLVGDARPLDARDLAVPGADVAPGWHLADAARRVERAARALAAAVGGLEARLPPADATGEDPYPVGTAAPRVLLAAMRRLAPFGFPGAVSDPVLASDEAGLWEAAWRLAAAGRARLAKAEDAAGGDPPATDEERLAQLRRRLATVFGGGMPLVTRFRPADAASLAGAFARSGDLLGGDQAKATGWLQKVAKVRAPAARLDDVLLLRDLTAGGTPLPVAVAQPLSADDPWAGEAAADDRRRGSWSLFALDLGGVAVLAGGRAPVVAGLAIDAWTERVPAGSVVTGVAVHHDSPTSRPPQSMLLVVPPRGEQWSFDLVTDSLLETLEFAKLRAVDPEALATYGHHFPAIFPPAPLRPGLPPDQEASA